MHHEPTLLGHPFLVKHVVFRKIHPLPSRSNTQQERSRLQQSCAELQTGQRSQTDKSNRLPRLARFRHVHFRDFNCWKIVESEPTKDIKYDDTLLDAIDRFGSRHRWASVFFLETVDPQRLPLRRLLKPQARSERVSETNLHERTQSLLSHSSQASLTSELPQNPTFPPRSPSSTQSRRALTRAALWRRKPMNSSFPRPSNEGSSPHSAKPPFFSPIHAQHQTLSACDWNEWSWRLGLSPPSIPKKPSAKPCSPMPSGCVPRSCTIGIRSEFPLQSP